MTVPSVTPSVLVGTLKALYETAKAFDKAPMQAAYMSLMEQLRAAQGEAYEMQEQIRAAERRIGELEEAARVRASVTYDRAAYWTGDSREIGPDGPFCTRCLDVDGKLVRLQAGASHAARCPHPACRGTYAVWPEKFRAAPVKRRGTWIQEY